MPQDLQPILVCFSDPAVREAFAALIESRGGIVEVGDSLHAVNWREQIPSAALSNNNTEQKQICLITEPMFAAELTHEQLSCTLVVGEEEDLARFTSPVLARPLTEENVEEALRVVLSRHP